MSDENGNWLKRLIERFIAPCKGQRGYEFAVMVLAGIAGVLVRKLWSVGQGAAEVAVLGMVAIFVSIIAFSWYHYAKELESGSSVVRRPAVHVDYNGCTVQVFLPDWNPSASSPFYQDGVEQKDGFDQALNDVDEYLHGRLEAQFQRMQEGDNGSRDLLPKMKRLYMEQKATYFVVTMSAKITGVLEGFHRWHSECRDAGQRVPILIATVASAPGLADSDRGSVRWYVRSEEENSLLATCLAWKHGVSRAGVFYVQHTPNRDNSVYGNRGREQFKSRFCSLVPGAIVDTVGVAGPDAAERVRQWLHDIEGLPLVTKTGAYIVGYGDMLKATLSNLIEGDFKGHIACVSTLTGSTWQPENRSLDHRIFTVRPRLKRQDDAITGDNRSVVFFFARETLRRVLEMTSQDPNALSFLARWKKGENATRHDLDDALDQEHLVNGDVVIHLDVIDSTKWRFAP